MPIIILQGFFEDIEVPTPTQTLDELQEKLAIDCEHSWIRDFYFRMGLTPPSGRN